MLALLLGAAAVIAFAIAAGGKKDGTAALPAGTPETPGTPGAADVPTPGGIPAGAGAPGSNDVKEPPTPSPASMGDAFDAAVAKAIAAKDIETLKALAAQAQAKGLLDVARSIQDEIARLQTEQGTTVTPSPVPPGANAPVSVKAQAAMNLTAYLRSVGGLAAKYKEDRTRVAAMLAQLGVPDSSGEYGPQAASAVITEGGVIPVAPMYWPKSNAAQAKNSFVALVNATPKHPADLAAWAALLADTDRSFQGKPANAPIATPKLPPAPVAAAPAPKPVSSPVPVVLPTPAVPAAPPAAPGAIVEHDGDTAARELTAYLVSIGGLKAREREDRKRIAAWLARLGVPDATGMYGRQGAGAVMQHGIVPVTPFYWPKTGTTQAKKDFVTLIKTFAAADPQRAAQWSALLADVNRS